MQRVDIFLPEKTVAQSYTILHVEDLKNNRELVRRILESRNYTVIDAVNGLEGIQKAMAIQPDLILMDINLPDLDGFSVVTRLRNHPPLATVPIIAITARNISDDPERARAIGCDGYISKPFSVKQLLDEVAAHIGKPRETQPESRHEHFLREHSATLVEELEQKLNELEAAHTELSAVHERLQRLDEAKTDFIHIAAHELRTPLTTVTAYASMLRSQMQSGGNDVLSEILEGLQSGVDRLNRITNDMVSIARVELANIELAYMPLSINSVLLPVLKELQPAIEKRQQTFKINIPDNLPLVVGDDTQLQQVFSRLIGNAIKYTPDGGTITISAKVHVAKNETTAQQKFVEVSVADTGIGIDKSEQGLIFEKFYTAEDTSRHSSGETKFMGGGPGLGLTIARGIVEAHGGRIWVESAGYNPENPPGSTFFVLLPTEKPKHPHQNQKERR